MKIALLTIWHVGNYGAELQAYATMKVLMEMGHDVTIIDIRENEHPNPTLKNRLAGLISKMTPAYRNFNKFWSTNFPSKTRHYRSVEDLLDNPPEADAYVVGSDQVWNKDITAEKRYIYFLNFGPELVRRISYASSFGIDKWNDSIESTNKTKELLTRFSSISCREQSGIELLKTVFNLQASRVLDPTLLLNDYSNLIGNISDKDILTYYPLTNYPELDNFCRNLAGEMGLELVNANRTTYLTNSIPWSRPSVVNWMRAIAQAKFVVTPSFHGLVFALLFRRQFMIINRGGNQGRKTRMTDLLDALGLSDRFCESFEEAREKKLWEYEIDYADVYQKLNIMRRDSVNYLAKALS